MRQTLRLSAVALMSALGLFAMAGCQSAVADHNGGVPTDAKIEQDKPAVAGASVHVAAGDLAVGQGNADEAVKQYNKALSIEPNNKLALYKLAALFTYEKHFDEAVATWQKYVDATNQSAGGYVNLARANELAGNWKAAEVAYLRAINREPMNKAAHINYGVLLAKRDRIDEAEQQLGKSLTPAEVQYDIASVYELKNDFTDATTAYNKALELDPNFTAAKQRLSMMKAVTSAQ